jgi:hypothetical protein
MGTSPKESSIDQDYQVVKDRSEQRNHQRVGFDFLRPAQGNATQATLDNAANRVSISS